MLTIVVLIAFAICMIPVVCGLFIWDWLVTSFFKWRRSKQPKRQIYIPDELK